jgi:hypothetical protein
MAQGYRRVSFGIAAAVMPAALTLCAACSSVQVTYLDPALRPPTQSIAVEVLREEPTRRYKIVARFQISDRGWNFTNAELERRVRMETGRVGGEAAIVEERTENHLVLGGLFIGHTAVVSQRIIVARAVVFTKDEAQ